MQVLRALTVVTLLALAPSAGAAPPALMELQVGTETVRGKILALDGETCWFVRRDGRLDEWKVPSIAKARRVEPRFRPLTSVELRDALKKELGPGFEVVATRRYVVAAAPGSASRYAQLFEEVYGAFDRYFSVRGFNIGDPEFPLVAIVFPDHAAFADYCRQDGVRAVRGLMGYYHRRTNRVALFDPGDGVAARELSIENGPLQIADPTDAPLSSNLESAICNAECSVSRSVQAGLRDTIIHEAVHQAAFNTGLHSRAGRDPQWVIEGLAMVFESPGIRDSASQQTAASRINAERFVHFGNFAQQRRKAKSLAEFVSDDRAFQTATLDAYSQAWALSFYLVETRPADYARYLRRVAERDPLQPYGPQERLDDFKQSFGRDLDVLEASFLRYLEGLQ